MKKTSVLLAMFLVTGLGLSGCSNPNDVSLEDAKKGIRALFYDYSQACGVSEERCLEFFKEHNYPTIYDFSSPEVEVALQNFGTDFASYGTPDLDTVQEDPEWTYPESLPCDPVSISTTTPPEGKTFIVTSGGYDVHVTHLEGKFYFYQSLVVTCD